MRTAVVHIIFYPSDRIVNFGWNNKTNNNIKKNCFLQLFRILLRPKPVRFVPHRLVQYTRTYLLMRCRTPFATCTRIILVLYTHIQYTIIHYNILLYIVTFDKVEMQYLYTFYPHTQVVNQYQRLRYTVYIILLYVCICVCVCVQNIDHAFTG